MNSGFTKGVIIGSLIGTSIGMLVGPDIKNSKSRKKMMNSGKSILKKSGNIIGDVIDIFR